ncbi:paraquat-inducible protein A [Robbsia andropogonis]|uniref:Paraquat-inducible protein A n=1 Tax=Robbsia andropogonis TaxID=28092 RepID=A0A0F5K2B2_9BURK|nr:paraquat-inducible protein A [Robbsia andropogonis]KKB64233.1 paraquat-inducible protein A [Robbsia andropogonis]MCP1118806.1 paraquat-inducible protein A [Robbsia andropogonis]MCP1128273.1 paraquat-inducible protein A [Robbsia andropogonis]
MVSLARAQAFGVVACHGCGLVCEDVLDHTPSAACPRCGATLHRRKPASVARATAFLLAAMVFYIPANLYPVVYTELLGEGTENTILGGIIDFWTSGSHALALLIFIASVAVPCGKFLVLGLLLVSTRGGSSHALKERTTLYRLLELIGYWSMLDVFVVGWGAAIGNFGALSAAAPRIGILFFGLVVLLTILSAISFDPRLIWDRQRNE